MTIDLRFGRLHRSIDDHGVRGVVSLSLAAAKQAVVPHEAHVWYILELADDRPRIALPDGLRLESPVDLAPFDQLGAGGLSGARARAAEGGVPWLVLEGDRVAFACWILPHVPTRAARGGRLSLPDGMSCLEYSFTHEGYRGRGVAPAAWCAIADGLQADGVRAMVTKVEVENTPSRKAVGKAGFSEIAVVTVERRGLRLHADVSVQDAEASAFVVAGVRG